MHPVFSIWLLLPWALVVLALLFWGYRRSRLNRRQIALLLCLEVLCLASLLVVFLQPVFRTSKVREGASRVVLLGDMSRSMSVRDMPGEQSRRECLASVRCEGFSQRVEKIGFAGEMRRVPDFEGERLLPGASPIGSHLDEILEGEERSLPIGALVLLSDGVCNGGTDVFAVAKEYARRGIPISCVGIGGVGDELDYGVTWKEPSLKIQRDADFNLTALVNGGRAGELKVSLSEAGNILEQRTLNFKGGTEALVFTVKPRTEGFHSYKVTVASSAKEARMDNNSAFAAVEALPPPQFRILFLLGGLDWEQRFLNQFTAVNPQFTTSVITAVGDKHFIATGFPEKIRPPENSFPQDTAFYDDFDIVCLDARAVSLLEEKGLLAIRAFVENKGGGLLVRGALDKVPETLSSMLPAQGVQFAQSTMPAKFRLCQDALLAKNVNNLNAFASGVFLKQGEAFGILQGLKKSARPMALLDFQYGTGLPLVAGLPFGAGRVAQTGLESTWRWRLAGNRLHDAWWTALFQWLAEAARPRVRELNGRLAEAGEEFALELHVLDDEFNPAANATVNARVSCPNGTVQELVLEAAADEEGRYSALMYPEVEGEYRVQYSIALPGRTLSREAFFVAAPAGREMEKTAFNEALLRDVARITGGRYFAYGEFEAGKVPLSANIPASTSTRHLASTWVMAAVFAGAAILLCLFRRRFGLK